MSRLDEAVKSVPADASSADDVNDTYTDNDLDDQDAPEPVGEQGDADDQPDGKKSGRTIENVRGELLRKLEKSNSELMEELRAMREESRRAQEQYGVPANQSTGNNQTLDDMPLTQLKAALPTVEDPQQKQQLEEYIRNREIDEKVNERFNKLQSKSQKQTAEQKFNEQAVDRWPELRDKSSEFYRVADRILSEMGDSAADNPRAVLDAANEAGLELGQAPNTPAKRSKRSAGNVTSGRKSSSPPGRGSNEVTAEMEGIAGRLSDAMPGGKFSKEQLKRIAERSKEYQETLGTRVRG